MNVWVGRRQQRGRWGHSAPEAQGVAYVEKMLPLHPLFPGYSCAKLRMDILAVIPCANLNLLAASVGQAGGGVDLKLWLAILTLLMVMGTSVRNEYKCECLEINNHHAIFLPVLKFVPLKSHSQPFLH